MKTCSTQLHLSKILRPDLYKSNRIVFPFKPLLCLQCIANKAEKLAEEFSQKYLQNANETVQVELQAMRNDYQYYSSKYSNINDVPCTLRFETKNQCSNFKVLRNATATYLNMYLQRDKHFYHINVNTSHTSVHVPTNVFDGGMVWSMAILSLSHNYNPNPNQTVLFVRSGAQAMIQKMC